MGPSLQSILGRSPTTPLSSRHHRSSPRIQSSVTRRSHLLLFAVRLEIRVILRVCKIPIPREATCESQPCAQKRTAFLHVYAPYNAYLNCAFIVQHSAHQGRYARTYPHCRPRSQSSQAVCSTRFHTAADSKTLIDSTCLSFRFRVLPLASSHTPHEATAPVKPHA